nr:response regulator [Bacteroidota bacterium]
IDSLGFLWIGTSGGLFRYNGNDFVDYTKSFESQSVTSVLCKRNGGLFFTTDLGFYKVNYHANEVIVNLIKGGSGVRTDSLLWFPKELYEDTKGGLWLSDNNAIYRYHGNKLRIYYVGMPFDFGNYQGPFTFFEDQYKRLIAVSRYGSFYFHRPFDDTFEKIPVQYKLENVTACLSIGMGKFLIGANHELGEFRIDNFGKMQNYRTIDRNLDASSFFFRSDSTIMFGTNSKGLYEINTVNNIYTISKIEQINLKGAIQQIIEYKNSIFVASDNGLAIMQIPLFSSAFKKLTNGNVKAIAYDAAGKKIYFTDGKKIFEIDEEDLSWRVFYTSPIPNSSLLQILPVDGHLWVSDEVGMLRKISKGIVLQSINLSAYGSAIYDLSLDEKGNIWACQEYMDGVIKIDPRNQVTRYGLGNGLHSRINFIRNSPYTYVFLGSNSSESYLYYYNPEENNFVNLSKPLPMDNGNMIRINDLAFDNNGLLWLASDHGLLRVRGNEVIRVDLDNLTDANIKAIALDIKGILWIATNLGITKVDNGNIINFDQSEGLPSKTILERGLISDSKGRIWAGTIEGIAFTKSNAAPSETATPRIISIMDKGQLVTDQSSQRFNNLSYLDFTFISPEYPTESIIYRIKMPGKENEWKYLSGKSKVSFSDFKEGEYELVIQAKQLGNYLWSEPYTYSFRIYKIWYQSWLTWTVFGIAFLILFYIIVRWQSRRLKRDKQKLNKLVRERTGELERKTKEIEAKNKQLLVAKNEAERSSLAKAEFLSNMSHEIRTPMNAVIGMINILQMENPRPDQLDRISTLMFSAENLLSLINDILDFNKIDSGKVELENVEFDLREIVTNLKSGFEPVAIDKGVNIFVHYDDTIPDGLIGDPTRVSQVLTNLMANAVKFTEHGEITLFVTKRVVPGNEIEINFKVKDTGIGISSQKLEYIFDSFNQGNSKANRKYGGTGLGLAITKKLLEMMGSRIQVQSKPGVGSEFSFRIMFQIGNPYRNQRVFNSDRDAMPSLGGFKILLVEDNKINIKIAKQILEKWELEVDVAEDGLEAIKMFSPGKYHLILMDLHLPEVDGFDATREIRKHDKEIPIIALTAASLIHEKDKVFESGMNDFIAKPFKPNDLYYKISQNIMKRQV